MTALAYYTSTTLQTTRDAINGMTELQAAQRIATEQRLINRVSIRSLDKQLASMDKHDRRFWTLTRERDALKRRYAIDRRAYRRLMSAC
jgi:hypothetical protein